MRRTSLAAFAGAVALLAVLPARPAAERPGLAPHPAAQPDRLLTVFSDYTDRAVVHTIDATTRRVLSTVVDRPHVEEAGGGVVAAAPSSAQRCSNWGSYADFDFGYRQVWRLSEQIHIDSSGTPALSDWRTLLVEAKREWETTRNLCGEADTIIWDMPEGFPAYGEIGTACVQTDDLNVVGFRNLGGWSGGELLLAQTCLWSGGGFVYEGDIAFNNHPDVKWSSGAVSGRWDLQSVAAHEFGHLLGLGHIEEGANANTALAVMHPIVYQNDTRNRTLSRGDIDGAKALYPALFSYEIVSARIDNPAGAGQKLEPGRTYTAIVDVENRGYRPWKVADPNGVILATDPAGRCSSFVAADWVSCSDASRIDEDLSNALDGPENDWTIVAGGEVARYTFSIPVPWGFEGSSALEAFRIRGLPIPQNGTALLPVEAGTYAASRVGQSGPGLLLQNVLVRGVTGSAQVRIRNDGTAPWILGDQRVALVTDGPPGRCSKYTTSKWHSCTVASYVDTPQQVVLPGDVATFDFGFYAPLDPNGKRPLLVVEPFEMIVNGRPMPRFGVTAEFRFEIW